MRLMLLLLRVLDIFQPSPPIIVARDTTYIAAPLGRDGLPDYEKYWLETVRKGVTPENNACALLWQAVWPEKFDPPEYEMMRAELGLKQLPPAKDSLRRLYDEANQKRVRDWLRAQRLNRDDLDVDEIISSADYHRWTAQQFPPLAEWVRENERPLDLLVKASHRPRYYAPSPTLLDKYRDTLLVMLLPGDLEARQAAYSLCTRAMLRVGENRLNEAWSDLLAIHRLARLVRQGRTLVEQFVAASISSIAYEGTLVLLSSDHITAELARQVNHDLAGLTNAADFVDSLDHYERLETLDTIIHVTHEGPVVSLVSENPLKKFLFWITPIDRNIVLRHINQWYDRIVEVAKLQNRSDQKRELAKIEADLAAEVQATKAQANMDAAILSRTRKSQFVASFTWTLLKPATDDAISAELRTRTTSQLIRLAAALAVFRAEHRAYPAKLDELVPSVIKKLPVDLYNAKPFLYQRLGKGYLLYSAGENGVDDGGSHQESDIFKGQSLDELKNSDPEKTPPQIPAGTDDISIRVPRPPFALPKVKSSASAP
jgi:hypothetical protein